MWNRRLASWFGSRTQHPFFWVAVAMAPLCITAYVGAAIALIGYGNFEQAFGWTAAATRRGLVVSSVERGGAADGKLRPGDVVSAVSPGVIAPVGYYRRIAPFGRPYTVRVGSTQFELTAPIVRTGRRGAWMAILFGGIAFGGVGLFLAFVRPDLAVARLFSVAFVFVGFAQLVSSLDAISNQLPRTAQLVYGTFNLSIGLVNALLYHATTRLPGPVVPRWAWPCLGFVLYAIGFTAFISYGFTSAFLWWTDVDRVSQLLIQSSPWFALGALTRTFTELMGAVGSLTIVCWKFAHVRHSDERRRLRWLFTGCIVGATPFAVYKVLQTALVSSDPAALRDSAFRTVGNGAIAVVPIALAYAIAKHQVLDISVVIRRGLQYLLARNALTAVLLLPAAGLVYTIVANQDRTIRETLFSNPAYVGLAGVALLALRYRTMLRERLDHVFFREAYDREKMLMTLLDQLDELESPSQAARLIIAELQRGLHPEHVCISLRVSDTGQFVLTQSGAAPIAAIRISADTAFIAECERHPHLRARAPTEDDRGVHSWLNELHVDLIVPVVGPDLHLVGLLLLGPKKSEEPYTRGDCELLEAIAKQLAVVHENVRLKDQIGEERKIRDQVIERLEARSINLLKECPQCGACYDSSVQQCASDGRQLSVSLPVERVVDSQYRLDRLIGKGGMGAVYEAEDIRLRRTVAIKLLLGHSFGEGAALRRFEREARLCAKLNHPNIVTVFGYGTVPGKGAYLVMERLHGVTLRDELRHNGVLSPVVAADWFDQILEGVHAAHECGIVHRDLKPENVLIVRKNDHATRVKLLDFGLAKMRAPDDGPIETVSATGFVMGTFGYMAPEQLMGNAVDSRVDVFALGIMVVEALTGQRPFDRPTYAETLTAMHQGPFHFDAGSDHSALATVLHRCLATDPDARFASVVELRTELIPALRNCPMAAL